MSEKQIINARELVVELYDMLSIKAGKVVSVLSIASKGNVLATTARQHSRSLQQSFTVVDVPKYFRSV